MSSQLDIKTVGMVDTLISAMKHIEIDQHLDNLLKVSRIVQNIFLTINSEQLLLKPAIHQLLQEGNLIEHNNTLELLPQRYVEKQSLFTVAIEGYLSHIAPENEISETNAYGNQVVDLNALANFEKPDFRIIELFLEYLFRVKNVKISDSNRVKIFEIIAEEYTEMLREKDIQSLTILGQKTVMLVVTKIYDRINEDDALNILPKGPVSHEIMRFFFVIKQLVQL